MNSIKAERRRKSIIISGLIGSAGIFLSKFIGLFYAVPFSAILGSDLNSAYYGVAYQLYSYLLNICTAGFPFAIATLVAKYMAHDDYVTTLVVKKLSSALMCVCGFGGMLIVILFSTPLAALVMPDNGGASVETMRIVLILISFALFFVPILSSLRGFYQGLKHMEIYSLSQVLEQLVRVGFLLSFSAFAVYVLNTDRIWAVYFGVISTSVSAIIAILHMKFYDRKQMREFRRKAKEQGGLESVSKMEKKEIFKELVLIAFPYMLSAALGYCDSFINTVFINQGLQMHGDSSETIIAVTGAINYGVLKLMSIPMILAPGFSAAIIPHLSEALEKNDSRRIRKNIRECVEIVLYIGLPISFCLFAYARPLYYTLFTTESLDLSAQVLRWYSIEAFLSTIAPIFSSLLMAVGLRYRALKFISVNFLCKLVLTLPFLMWFGYPGTIYSDLIGYGAFMILAMRELSKRYQVKWKYTLRKFFFMLIGIAALYGVSLFFNMFGFDACDQGRMVSLLQMALSGVCALAAYLIVTYILQIPQSIFHVDLKKLMKRRNHDAA